MKISTTRTSQSDSSIVNNNATIIRRSKFKGAMLNISIVIIIGAGLFLYGYFTGEAHIKNRTIREVQYTLSSDYELDDWQVLELAIAKTESEFNPFAVGKANDCGILQITPIYVKDFNRISGKNYQISDAFDIQKSLEMFSVMQKNYNGSYNIDKAMHLHNPGGKSVNYFERVYNNIVFIKRMEAVRKEVLKNSLYVNSNVVVNEEDSTNVKSSSLSSTPVAKLKVTKK